MAAKKEKVEPADEPQSFTFETFRQIGAWERSNLTREPSCVNGVDVIKYRVTVERVDEPAEVVAERVRRLWRNCDNHTHHASALLAAGRKYGIELDLEEFGVDRRRK